MNVGSGTLIGLLPMVGRAGGSAALSPAGGGGGIPSGVSMVPRGGSAALHPARRPRHYPGGGWPGSWRGRRYYWTPWWPYYYYPWHWNWAGYPYYATYPYRAEPAPPSPEEIYGSPVGPQQKRNYCQTLYYPHCAANPNSRYCREYQLYCGNIPPRRG